MHAANQQKAKVKLSAQQARQIYAIQAAKAMQKHAIFQRELSAAAVARQFGVTEKAVRDIWKGRTWRREIEAHGCLENGNDESAMCCDSEEPIRGDDMSPCSCSSPPSDELSSPTCCTDSQHKCHNVKLEQIACADAECEVSGGQKGLQIWEAESHPLNSSNTSGTRHCPEKLPDNDPFHNDWPYW
eukprot:CAMPEP_0113684422 /NCGR_PEP_ID=MMETSP0038_2-20120614/13996_1 /TAXON_ID=2898 /ORGANISM="Cryptomonas paramecium" /LENGTH=185 /DNA_ID=CAMNT_0000604173 /DNA_START=50 /DNA_END=604 /DNA_ORIENTATION=+ /assembly_acc=CAM_ASM_000170